MYIDIKQISGKGLLLDDSLEMDENLLVEEDSFFLEDVEYNIFLKREGNRIISRGRIRTAVSLRCVNCLENFELKVSSKFDIILFPISLIEMTNAALNPEEMEYIFYEGNRVDLTKILVEQVNLFIPFSPMCDSDCKGICANCGMNLNYNKCKCENSLTEVNFLFDKIKR